MLSRMDTPTKKVYTRRVSIRVVVHADEQDLQDYVDQSGLADFTLEDAFDEMISDCLIVEADDLRVDILEIAKEEVL